MLHKSEFNHRFFNQPKQNYSKKALATGILLEQLVKSLNQYFPIEFNKRSFRLYPFSNECFLDQVLNTLKNMEAKESDSNRVALLFGESNFISMLPELLTHSDLVLMADIAPLQHTHTKHLLNCLTRANTPEEFIAYYKENNPIEGIEDLDDDKKLFNWDVNKLVEILTLKSRGISSAQEYFFLSSVERYNQCKEAATHLKFAHVNFNLLDPNQCQQFVSILNEYGAKLSLCNFTNIHHYDKSAQLKLTVPLLLKDSPGCFLMYADDYISSLGTNISQNLDDYFAHKITYVNIHEIKVYDFDIDDFSVNYN